MSCDKKPRGAVVVTKVATTTSFLTSTYPTKIAALSTVVATEYYSLKRSKNTTTVLSKAIDQERTMNLSLLLLLATTNYLSAPVVAFSPPTLATARRSRSLFAATQDKQQNAASTAAASAVVVNGENASLQNKMPDLVEALEVEAELAVMELVDETCEIEFETGGPVDPECLDEELRVGFRQRLKAMINRTLELVTGSDDDDDELELELTGDMLEEGWERRGNVSALRRNAEVWKFALKCVFKILKARKLQNKEGVTEEQVMEQKVAAATYLRDGLLELGPTFVKVRLKERMKMIVCGMINTHTHVYVLLTRFTLFSSWVK